MLWQFWVGIIIVASGGCIIGLLIAGLLNRKSGSSEEHTIYLGPLHLPSSGGFSQGEKSMRDN